MNLTAEHREALGGILQYLDGQSGKNPMWFDCTTRRYVATLRDIVTSSSRACEWETEILYYESKISVMDTRIKELEESLSIAHKNRIDATARLLARIKRLEAENRMIEI